MFSWDLLCIVVLTASSTRGKSFILNKGQTALIYSQCKDLYWCWCFLSGPHSVCHRLLSQFLHCDPQKQKL